jgi:hypothetical protein
LVEHELPKLGVAGSNPVARSIHPVTSVLLDIYQGRWVPREMGRR